MKAAHLATSPRLQRVAELRANGLKILCRRCGDIWVYWIPDCQVAV